MSAVPNNGHIIKWATLRYRLRAQGSGTTPGATVSAQMTTAYAVDIYTLATGFGLYLTGASATDAWTAKYDGPNAPYGGYTVSGSGWSDNSIEARFINAVIYMKLTGSLWLCQCDSIEIWVNGSLSTTLGGIAQESKGVGPNYVPIWGLPACVTGDTTWSVTPPSPPYSISGSSNATIRGWMQFQEVAGGPWRSLPMTVAPVEVPALTGSGLGASLPSYNLSDTGSASISLAFSGGTTYTQYHGSPDYYHQTSYFFKNKGTYWLQPDLLKTIQRLNSDYRSLWLRLGMPKTVGYAQHGTYRSFAGPSAIIEDHVNKIQVHPSQRQILGAVGYSRHPMEDTFDYPSYAPLILTANALRTDVDDPADPAGNHTTTPPVQETINYVFPFEVEDYDTNPDLLNNNYHANPLARYFATWCNPHWSYGRWTGAKTWKVDYSPETWGDYWGRVRQQFITNPRLSTAENRMTRASIVLSHCEGDQGNTPFLDNYFGGLRWIGCSRFQVYESTPLSTITLSTAKPGLWQARDVAGTADCSVSLGASGITLSGFNANPAAVDLQFGAWTQKPYMLLYLAKKVAVSWSTSNVALIQVSLIGYDDSETVLGTTQTTYTLPKGGQTKYAGSYAIDNGADVATDTGTDDNAAGISSTVMGDPEAVLAFQLGQGRTFKALRFTVTPTSMAGTVLLYWPTFDLWDTHPNVYWENGKCAALLWPNGPGLRRGNWTFYHPVFGWQYPPLVTGLGANHTIIDSMAFHHLVWRGDQGTGLSSAITAELNTMYDSYEGQSIGVVDKFSTGVLLPKGTDETVRDALCNSFSEPPPLSLFPARRYNGNWQQTGAFAQVVYDAVYETHPVVSPSGAQVKVKNPGGTLVGSADATAPPGWYVWNYAPRLSVDGDDDAWKLWSGPTNLATVRPWSGWTVVSAAITSTGAGQYSEQTPDGRYMVATIENADVRFRRAAHSIPAGNVWDSDQVVTSYGDVRQAAFAVSLANQSVSMVIIREIAGSFQAWRGNSNDFGATFGGWSYVADARRIYNGAGAEGSMYEVYFVYDSGSSGPGRLYGRYRGPGDTSYSAPYLLKNDAGANLKPAEVYAWSNPTQAKDGQARWVITMTLDGETDPSTWFATDLPPTTYKRVS